MKTTLLAAIAALTAGCTSTVIPEPVRDAGVSYDGSDRNGGFLGFYTNSQGQSFSVITPRAKVRYDELAVKYGQRESPRLSPGDGLTAFTNGTWLIDLEHDVKAREMNRWRKSEAP